MGGRPLLKRNIAVPFLARVTSSRWQVGYRSSLSGKKIESYNNFTPKVPITCNNNYLNTGYNILENALRSTSMQCVYAWKRFSFRNWHHTLGIAVACKRTFIFPCCPSFIDLRNCSWYDAIPLKPSKGHQFISGGRVVGISLNRAGPMLNIFKIDCFTIRYCWKSFNILSRAFQISDNLEVRAVFL